ncbi:MAG: chaperone modulator CbpM [Pseudomonadales bacterium]
MSRSIDPELLDERHHFTLGDMCRICGVHAEFLVELMDEGVIAPRGEPAAKAAQAWQFDGIAVVRVQRAVRLQQDLGVNLAGIALALELLDEIEALRRRP